MTSRSPYEPDMTVPIPKFVEMEKKRKPGGEATHAADELHHQLGRQATPGQAEGTPDTTPEATPVPEVRGREDLRAGPPASGQALKEKFLVEYRDSTMTMAAAACGIADEDVEDWLVDDEEFADGFERVNRLKALRIRQKFLDAFDKISDTIIRQAQSGGKHKASMAAAKLALDLAGFGKKSARRVDAASEPEDAEAQAVAREMGWLP